MEGELVASVKLGWMWFDNDPKSSLEQKLAGAVERYQQKFGMPPRRCYVSQGTLAEPKVRCGTVQLVGARNVLPGHFLFEVQAASALQAA